MSGKKRKNNEEKKGAKSSRFNFDCDDDFEDLSRGYIPPSTAADTAKCVKLFKDWTIERNLAYPEDQIPDDILLTDNAKDLCKWLCRFSAEIRKNDGSRYPPKTIQHYLVGLQRHIREEKRCSFDFMKQSEFVPLKNLLDALYRKLLSEGVGCSSSKTEALTDIDEEKLWSTDIQELLDF